MTNDSEKLLVPCSHSGEFSPAQIEERAYELINRFKKEFKKIPEFQGALVEHYFGELDYGYLVDPERRDKLTFWYKGVSWQVGVSLTTDEQTMGIEVENAPSFPLKLVQLILRSKRKDPLHTESPLVQVIGISSDFLEEPVIYKNNKQAVETAQKLLEFLGKKK